jgi:hypothetical protein
VTFETLAVAAAMSAGLYHRLVIGWNSPFWLDEAYTGTIASQTTIDGLILWCRHELSGPIYYSALWLWEKFAGNGDDSLRLPSLFFSVGAVLLIAISKELHLRDRLLWASLTAVWLPGLTFAAQARPQALLFLLATGQAITFLRCMSGPSGRRLAIWSLLTSLMVMTHIHAILISGFQFFFLIASFRARLLNFWPAFTVLLIAACWLPLQFSIISAFLKPGMASYAVLQPAYLWLIPLDALGNSWSSFAVVVAVLVILATQIMQHTTSKEPWPYSRAETTLVLSGALAIAIVVSAGLLRSSYFPRYLIPFMPSMLFGLALVLRRTPIFWGLLPGAVLIAWTHSATSEALSQTDAETQYTLFPYEFELSSTWLMDRDARHILFIWDNPSSALNDPVLQSEMAGFFFRRAGYHATVRAVPFDSQKQEAPELAMPAIGNVDGILWIDGVAHPDTLRAVEGFDCKRFGVRRSRSMACVRKR